MINMIDINFLKDISYDVLGAIDSVHKEMGPGLNEYVYQEALQMELTEWSIDVEREVVFHPTYRGHQMESTFRLDFLCDKRIIVECKAVAKLSPENRAQLFNYMRLTRCPVGILVNFAPRYYEMERYFYDVEDNIIRTSDGEEMLQYTFRNNR